MPIRSQQRVSTLPNGLELSGGRLDNAELKGSSGLNSAVGTSLETISASGGLRNYLTAAEDLKVVSSSTSDTNSGSGACRRIRIRGIGSDGLFKEQDVNMNGTTVVDVDRNGDPINFLYINDMRVQTVGSGGAFNAGTITLYANDGTTVLETIGAGENQQQTAAYAIADNQTGYLTSFVCSATGNAQVSIWVQPGPNAAWGQRLTLLVGAGGPTPYQLPNPFSINSGGKFEFRAKSLTGSDVAVGADFQIILET